MPVTSRPVGRRSSVRGFAPDMLKLRPLNPTQQCAVDYFIGVMHDHRFNYRR